VPLRDAGLVRVDYCADCGQRRLAVFGFVSPNGLAISGSRPQAQRGGRAVRCIALLGVVTVPKPMEGTALPKCVSCRAGDGEGIAGWIVTRRDPEGLGTGCRNLESVLFGPCRLA
jgi:hypothetical protein